MAQKKKERVERDYDIISPNLYGTAQKYHEMGGGISVFEKIHTP